MPINIKPETCKGCPAYYIGKGFVRSSFNRKIKLAILGSGPNSDEYLDGEFGTGFVGRKLHSWLVASGLDQFEIGSGHVVQCQLPYQKGLPRPPAAAEVAFCQSAHWGPKLTEAEPQLVVALGIPALKAALNRPVKNRDFGIPFQLDGHVVIGVQTPATIMNGQFSSETFQIEYLKHAKDILTTGKVESTGFDVIPFHIPVTRKPSLSDLKFWWSGQSMSLVVDIETAGDHLRIVGLYDTGCERYLSFPVRSAGGGSYWSKEDLPAAVSWLFDLLSSPHVTKCFHNGQAFDIPVLERNGFVVNGYTFDTMLGMHVAYPGIPKGLEELSKVYLRSGGWKSLVRDVEADGEGK